MSGAYSSGVPFYHSGSRIPDDAHKLQQQQLRCANGESNEAVFDGNGNDFNYSNTDIGYRNTSYTYPDDTEDDEVKQGDDDDEGDAMPEEFYQKVETFLSKGPPRLKKAKSASGPTLLASVSSRPTAANIPKSATASTTGKKKSVSIPRNTEAKRGGAIDEGLLRDAFAYTDHILREAVLEERAELGKTAPVGLNFSKKSDDAMDHRGGGGFGTGRGTIASSSSRSSQGHGVTRKGSEGSSSSGGVVQKLRNKTQSLGQKNSSSSSSASANRSGGRDYGGGGDSLSAVFNVSAVDIESEACDKRGTFDMGSLVQNFESGVTLQRLRLELAASKEAMSKSREAIQNISDSYHGGDLSGRRRDSVGSLMRKKNPDIRT